MSYRPQLKADSNGTTQDLPIDAETVQGKTPVFTTTSQTISGVKIYKDTQKFEADINIDGTITERGTLLSNKYANKSEVDNQLSNKSNVGHSHESILDYGDTTNTIKIGYRGNGLTASQIAYIAGYSVDDPNNPNEHKIKDISKDVLKSWLGYAEVATGALSVNTSLTIETGYVYLIFLKATNTSFKFGTSKTNLRYTAYGYMIVLGGNPVLCRYFSNTTTITMATVGSSTLGLYFDSAIQYIKFYAG